MITSKTTPSGNEQRPVKPATSTKQLATSGGGGNGFGIIILFGVLGIAAFI